MARSAQLKTRSPRIWADLPLTVKGLVVIALPLVILIASLVMLYMAFSAESRAEEDVRRAFAIQRDMYQVHSLLAEAGGGVREFILTGEDRSLRTLNDAQELLPQTLARLDVAIEDRAVREAYEVFLSLSDQKLDGLEQLAEIATQGGSTGAIQQSLNSNRTVLDELRLQMDEIQQLEQEVLDRRRAQVDAVRELFLRLTAVSAVVGLLGSLAAVFLFSTGIVRRVHLLEASAERLERGEPLPAFPDDADEIGQLAGKLDRASALLRARESDLRESEERFRLVVEGVRDYGIFALTPEGRVATWNMGAERTKGWKADEILGEYFGRFYPEETRDYLPEAMLDRARRDGRAEDEGWRVRKDGARFWANVVVTALYDENGALKGYAKVTRDMTERKRSEEALRAAQKEAVAANDAKSDFLSRTSHELRTPMSAILGFAQMLELDQDGFHERHRVAVGQILKAGRHLLSLIDDLLDISSIEAGGEDLKVERLEIDKLLTEARDLAQPLLNAAGLRLELEQPDRPVWVMADQRRVTQVTLNLLSNAGKYSPADSRVRLSARVSEDKAIIEVEDEGPGVSDENIPRLFTPFDRLGKGGTNGVKGTGLGLALSKRLVESMGGEIGFHNRNGSGGGSVFWFSLPLAGDGAQGPRAGTGARAYSTEDTA
ncbi:MAG: PAS domain S-box protein [Hyphomonas sp.]|nr:PAS domain S-box protein [Hyphomonas sp.]